MYRYKSLLLIFFTFVGFTSSFGQLIPDIRGDGTIRGSGDGLPEKERSQEDFVSEQDTFGVFSFYANNPNEEESFADSLLHDFFHQYDPARNHAIDYFHLGPLGSATMPILYEPQYRQGFDVGLNQYNLYHIRAKDLPFRRLEKPFTNLTYTQVGEQSDTYFKGEFSRNFADGLNVNIDYQNIAMVGRQNHFPNQNSRHTSISTGLWYHSKNEKYDGFLSYAANTVEQQDNGGIQLEPDEETASSALVFLTDAQTRHAHRELLYTHYYKFGGQPDSTSGRLKRAYTLNHQIGYLNSIYKFFDDFGEAASTADSLYYGNLLTDFRGTRFYLEHTKVENTFKLSTFSLNKKNLNSAQSQKDLIEVGLMHALHQLDLESGDSTLNNLFLSGRLHFNPNERLRLRTYAHLGLLNNGGDYRLEGDLFLDFKQFGNLSAKFVNQLSTPNLIQNRLIVSQREVWKNDFDKVLSTSLSGRYTLPQAQFSANAAYHLVNNFLYFDSNGLVQQSGTPVSILQLSVQKEFRLGNFYLDNLITIQEITEDFLPLPGLFSKHSLYYDGKWFKVLKVRVGVDVRFTTSYTAPYYNPLTGQFQLSRQFSPDITDRREIDFYPAADAFLSLQVTKFRAFAKWENLYQMISNEQYYQVAYYPQWLGGLRLGISWRFVN